MFSSITYYLQEKHIKDLVELKRILLHGGAKKEFYLSSLVQYVICDDEDTAKRIEEDVKEANPEAVIVKSDWIMLSSKCGVLLPYELFTYTGDKIFSGFVFCPSGLSHVDCAKLWTMVQYNGGRWQKKLDSTVTHLVTCRTTGDRYQCAVEHGVNVVTPDWILDCDAHSTRLPESSYHPSVLAYEEETPAVSSEAFNGPSSVGEHEENVVLTENDVAETFQNKAEEQEKYFPSTSTEDTTIESTNHLGIKPQVWKETSSSSVLEGMVFHIIDYPQCIGEETIEKWKKVICSNGGVIMDHYDTVKCTHLLAQRTGSEMCRKALAEGKCVSSAYWLNNVLTTEVMRAPSNPLHFPTACTGRVDNPQNYSITLTNYLGIERRLVKDMIKSTGLPYTGFLSKQTTHLICKCVGGKKYEKAQEWGLKIVNSKFIGDIIFTGEIPELSERHFALNKDDEFTVTHPIAFSMLEPWHLFLQHHYSQPQYTTESLQKRGRSLDDSEEDDSSNKKARVTDRDDSIMAEVAEDIDDEACVTVAPSLIQQPRIVFTGVSGAVMIKMKEIVSRLGGVEVDARECTHLVTSKLTRTIKFLCAISVAKHMVTTSWIYKSGEVGYFIDEAEFMLTDAHAEATYGFSISTSLREAQNKKLLQGLTFFCTPQVIPSLESLKEIIGCAGGELISLHALQMMDVRHKTLKAGLKLFKKPLIVLTCTDDLDCEELLVFEEAGIGIYNTEFVMTGVVRQRLEYETNRMKPTIKKQELML